jgi:hypothetical protein
MMHGQKTIKLKKKKKGKSRRRTNDVHPATAAKLLNAMAQTSHAVRKKNHETIALFLCRTLQLLVAGFIY